MCPKVNHRYLYQAFTFSQFNGTMSSVSCFYPYYEFLPAHLYLCYNLSPEDRIHVTVHYNFGHLSRFNNPLSIPQSVNKKSIRHCSWLPCVCFYLPALISQLKTFASTGRLFWLCGLWSPHKIFYSALCFGFGITLLPQMKTQWIGKFGQPRI